MAGGPGPREILAIDAPAETGNGAEQARAQPPLLVTFFSSTEARRPRRDGASPGSGAGTTSSTAVALSTLRCRADGEVLASLAFWSGCLSPGTSAPPDPAEPSRLRVSCAGVRLQLGAGRGPALELATGQLSATRLAWPAADERPWLGPFASAQLSDATVVGCQLTLGGAGAAEPPAGQPAGEVLLMAPTDLRLESAGTGGAASALRVIVGAAEIRAGLAEVGQVEAITAACAAGVARGADAAAAAIQGAVDAGTGPRGADGPSDGQDSNAIADDDLRTGPFVCVFTRPRSRQPVPALPFHVQVCPRRGVWGGGRRQVDPASACCAGRLVTGSWPWDVVLPGPGGRPVTKGGGGDVGGGLRRMRAVRGHLGGPPRAGCRGLGVWRRHAAALAQNLPGLHPRHGPSPPARSTRSLCTASPGAMPRRGLCRAWSFGARQAQRVPRFVADGGGWGSCRARARLRAGNMSRLCRGVPSCGATTPPRMHHRPRR